MYIMIGIKTNDFIVSVLNDHMDSKRICHTIMIDLISIKCIGLIWLSGKSFINLLNSHV